MYLFLSGSTDYCYDHACQKYLHTLEQNSIVKLRELCTGCIIKYKEGLDTFTLYTASIAVKMQRARMEGLHSDIAQAKCRFTHCLTGGCKPKGS